MYPLRLSDATSDDGLLPGEEEWRENLDPAIAAVLEQAYGRRPSVEEIAWFAFGVLSAPSYRRRFAAPLAIEHPRIPFPAESASFEAMGAIGEELARVHLLEVDVADDIRFVGDGSGIIEAIRHDPELDAVWVNGSQRFTGVPVDSWAWGGSFRPLEHYLTDRRGRHLDTAQIQAYQSAIHAVRECIRMAPALDSALDDVIAHPLEFRDADT